MSEHDDTHDAKDDDSVQRVQHKAERMARARRAGAPFWRDLMASSTLGWSFILPVLGWLVVGRILGRILHRPSLTLVGLVVGIVMGAIAVYSQVRRSLGHHDNDKNGGSP